jgi:hypothetical protein
MNKKEFKEFLKNELEFGCIETLYNDYDEETIILSKSYYKNDFVEDSVLDIELNSNDISIYMGTKKHECCDESIKLCNAAKQILHMLYLKNVLMISLTNFMQKLILNKLERNRL